MRATLDEKDFLHALHGLDFPASRSAILNHAKDTGGINGQVALILEQIPDRTYESAADLTAEIRNMPAASNEDAATKPAAGSAIPDATKDLIGTMADPRRGDLPVARQAAGDAGEGQADARRILARNHEIIEGDEDPDAPPTGVGHMVSTDRSHVGNSSNND